MIEDSAVGEPAGSRVGSLFGPYRLIRLLGSGGFGEVYEAEDTTMHRVVALKLLASTYSHNPVFRERLFREARTAGRLREPHVVPIHGCGEIDGQIYIDMRLVRGVDLETLLHREGTLDPARAVAIVRQIAAALDAARAETVIHRDVKPANILLAGEDFASLVDFGLATAAGDARLTKPGKAVGTFDYVAPERLSGDPVDHRADVYSLACVLYECLAGAAPFEQHRDLPELMTAHMTAPVPVPSQQRPGIPAGFDEVIARGLAKNPDDRYPSAGALATAAQRALGGGQSTRPWAPPHPQHPPHPQLPYPPTVPPRHRKSRRRIVITVAAIAHVAAIAATAVVLGVKKLGLGASRPTDLPFVGLYQPKALAADKAGNVYVGSGVKNKTTGRIFRLAAGAATPNELDLPRLNYPARMAVDTAGNLFIAEAFGRVLEVPAGATGPLELPFKVKTTGVAVDPAGNVYVAARNTKDKSDRVVNPAEVLKLAPDK